MKLVVLFLLLILPVALAACSASGGEGGAEPAPDGYARYEGGGVTFVHPEHWEVTEHEVDDGFAVSMSEPDPSSGVPFGAGFERGGAFPAGGVPFSDYAEQFDTLADMNLPQRETVRFEAIEVPGADDARLIEARYLWPDGDVPVRQYDVLLLQQDREEAPVFRISAAEEEWDAEVVETMLSSLALES